MQTVDKAFSNLKITGTDAGKLLDKFRKLGISPIPLSENFCAKQIPGPVGLLKQIAKGDVIVEYTKEK